MRYFKIPLCRKFVRDDKITRLLKLQIRNFLTDKERIKSKIRIKVLNI